MSSRAPVIPAKAGAVDDRRSIHEHPAWSLVDRLIAYFVTVVTLDSRLRGNDDLESVNGPF
jgi:hypothetical protein